MEFTMDDLHWGPRLKHAIMINSGLRGSIGNGIFDNATALEILKVTTETPLIKTAFLDGDEDNLHTGISGTIPDELFAHAAQLRTIEITHNRALSGTMPLSIGSPPSLGMLLLHDQVLEPQCVTVTPLIECVARRNFRARSELWTAESCTLYQ